MLDYARKARTLLKGRTRGDLDEDELLSLALTRVVEIIGEAATRVSHESQQDYALIPWPQIIGLRNRLVHGYDAVDFEILWDIIHSDIPPLIEQLEAIIEKKL
jgi:uncharacterized protein with HEPN domain